MTPLVAEERSRLGSERLFSPSAALISPRGVSTVVNAPATSTGMPLARFLASEIDKASPRPSPRPPLDPRLYREDDATQGVPPLPMSKLWTHGPAEPAPQPAQHGSAAQPAGLTPHTTWEQKRIARMKERVSMLSPRTAEASEALRATRSLHEELPDEIIPRSPIFSQRVQAERTRLHSVVQSGVAMDRVLAREEAVSLEDQQGPPHQRARGIPSVVVTPQEVPSGAPAPQGSEPAPARAAPSGHKHVEGRLWNSVAQRSPREGPLSPRSMHGGRDEDHKRFMAMEMNKVKRQAEDIDEDDYEMYMGEENRRVMERLQPDATHPFNQSAAPVAVARSVRSPPSQPAFTAGAAEAVQADAKAQHLAEQRAARQAAARRSEEREAEMQRAAQRKAELEEAAARRREGVAQQKAYAAQQQAEYNEAAEQRKAEAARRQVEAKRAQRAVAPPAAPVAPRATAPVPAPLSEANEAYMKEMAGKAEVSRQQRRQAEEASRQQAQAAEAEKAQKEAQWRAAMDDLAGEKAAKEAKQAAQAQSQSQSQQAAGTPARVSLSPPRSRSRDRRTPRGGTLSDDQKAAKREAQNRELEEEKRQRAQGPSQYSVVDQTQPAPARTTDKTSDFIRQQETKISQMTNDLDSDDEDDFNAMMAAENARLQGR